MNYYNPYGNFCMEYSDDTCEVMGVIIVEAGEILWRMRVAKKDANYVTVHQLAEHYLEMKYAKTADVQDSHHGAASFCSSSITLLKSFVPT